MCYSKQLSVTPCGSEKFSEDFHTFAATAGGPSRTRTVTLDSTDSDSTKDDPDPKHGGATTRASKRRCTAANATGGNAAADAAAATAANTSAISTKEAPNTKI